MHTLLALLLFVVVFVVPNQVTAEDGGKDTDIVEKRQVSVLARDGHLPYQGKRYVGEKQPDSKTSETSWEVDSSNLDPSVFLVTNKRYVGALAKSGDLRFKQRDDKRDDVDTLIDELLTAEELRRIRLEALREELLQQREDEDEEGEVEKRSLAALARTGNLPFRDGKRSIASMARAGFLRSPSSFLSNDDYSKRGISSLARNGELPSYGKRGGIASIMRNGFSYQKRSYGSDMDNVVLDEPDEDEKRNVASLARGFNLPSTGKRNIASFARNGWLQDFGPSAKKSAYGDWEDTMEDSKRNLPSLLRNRVSPLVEGKRYLGAFVASNRLPYMKQNYDDSKRNIGAMARNWNFPESYRFGKRFWFDEYEPNTNDELAKRYVSSLLKQGPLPVLENFDNNSEDNQNYNVDQQQSKDESENAEEEKRHIGSLVAQKSFAMRKKKSISPEDQFPEQPSTVSSASKSRSDENKMNNEIQQSHRQKREAFAEFAAASDEYPMPVMQNTEVPEYDDENNRINPEEQSTRKKRYFAVRGGGKIPGGRLPHVGRSRSNNPNSGRRRH